MSVVLFAGATAVLLVVAVYCCTAGSCSILLAVGTAKRFLMLSEIGITANAFLKLVNDYF